MSNVDDLLNDLDGWHTTRRSLNGDGEVIGETQVPERLPYKPIDGAKLVRRSTLVDGEGNVSQQWVIEKQEDVERYERFLSIIEELKADMPRAPIIPMPEPYYGDLLVGYPVGDHHMGMLSWKHETGASYDLEVGEALLTKAVSYLADAAPPADTALLALLGDYMHYDSMAPMTPNHGNILDADGRAHKMVRAATRAVRVAIETLARKHLNVHVIVEFGNHDPYSMVWLGELLRVVYEDNPRITIDSAPGGYHYYRFGKNLIATHHGDTVTKLEALPNIMAHDRASDWGETLYRTWWTGHRHSRTMLDAPGCSVEVHRILPPPDAWAHSKGYRSHRTMQAIVYDREQGELGRHSVSPGMIGFK